MIGETRILAIDFGEKRIGTAISDPLKIIAQPFEMIANDQQCFPRLTAIMEEKQIEKIILGFPYRDDGAETVVTEKIRIFKKELEKRFNLPVILVDESFSSSIAADRVQQSIPKKMKRRDKSLLDIHAAVVILEDYLRNNYS